MTKPAWCMTMLGTMAGLRRSPLTSDGPWQRGRGAARDGHGVPPQRRAPASRGDCAPRCRDCDDPQPAGAARLPVCSYAAHTGCGLLHADFATPLVVFRWRRCVRSTRSACTQRRRKRRMNCNASASWRRQGLVSVSTIHRRPCLSPPYRPQPHRLACTAYHAHRVPHCPIYAHHATST